MHAARVEEASALAIQIAKDITRRNARSLNKLQASSNMKEVWAKVRQLTKRRDDVSAHCQITADTLNRHYASVSTDSNYRAPLTKQTTDLRDDQFLTEIEVFKQLDKLHHTATGLDQVPAWFLRLGAAVFAKPIAKLYNASLARSVVPLQWKKA